MNLTAGEEVEMLTIPVLWQAPTLVGELLWLSEKARMDICSIYR